MTRTVIQNWPKVVCMCMCRWGGCRQAGEHLDWLLTATITTSETIKMRSTQQSVAYSRIHLGWISLLTATSTNNQQLIVISKWKQRRQRSIQACIPKAPHSNCYTSMLFTDWAISERVKTTQRSLCRVYIAGMIITTQTSGKLQVSLLFRW